MNRGDLKENDVDGLIAMIAKMNIEPLMYKSNGKNGKKRFGQK